MIDAILVLNVGSSSIKFALHRFDTTELLFRGHIERVGAGDTSVKASGPRSELFEGMQPPGDVSGHDALMQWLLQTLAERVPDITVRAAGHRVVHGGMEFAAPVQIATGVLEALDRLVPLAPNHQPHNLAAIRQVERAWPGLPQVACFDTAFHRTQPRHAQLFALPRSFAADGVLRYGFHGLSYEYIAGALPTHAGARADGRVVVAHLGQGASLCALRERRSVATTMGFTALDGLMMGRRSGAIDPGVLLYLLQEKKTSPMDLADLLYNRSGLFGVSGISDDVRELEASDHPDAEEALDLFAYRAAREIGSVAAAIDGIDVIVFTAGIGEHSASMRRRICGYSGWLGLTLDESANTAHGPRISASDSKVAVYVIPTDEELVIARAVRALMR
jgi:acetate kinase